MDDALKRCVDGVVPPMCTPLTEAGDVDVTSLLRLRRRLIRGGVAGLFALGSTGEASYLSNKSRYDVVELLSALAAEDGLPLFVGVVEPTALRVVEAARSLVTPQTDVVVATGPFYAAASALEITRHFETIAAGVDVPVLAYNIPSNVGYDLPTDVVADLIQRGVVAGLKDSSPSLGGFRQLLLASGRRSDVAYFSGSDGLLDATLHLGANGSVAGLANVAPELFVSAIDAHRSGDLDRLAQSQDRIVTLTRLYTTSDPGAGLNSTQLGSIKTALKAQGVIDSDQVSTPMLRSSAAKAETVAELLANAGVLDVDHH